MSLVKKVSSRVVRAELEDATQVAAARTCGARYIVTRNVRDYERSPIRAVDPQRGKSRLRAVFWPLMLI